jgi:hypothetical protein
MQRMRKCGRLCWSAGATHTASLGQTPPTPACATPPTHPHHTHTRARTRTHTHTHTHAHTHAHAHTHTHTHTHTQISTVNMGLAAGWSAVILGYGRKGLRKSLPHSLGAWCAVSLGRCRTEHAGVHASVCVARPARVLTAPRLSCCPPPRCQRFTAAAAAMLAQPRVPPTGQRQAVEVHIKWREVSARARARACVCVCVCVCACCAQAHAWGDFL